MTQINPKKLINSKWTAQTPDHKEKHFIITKVVFSDNDDAVEQCIIEAVLTKRVFEINWPDLKNERCWVMGWQ